MWTSRRGSGPLLTTLKRESGRLAAIERGPRIP